MNIKQSFLLLFATMIPLAAFGADALRHKSATPEIQKSTMQHTQALVPGSYVGPNGLRIQVKRTMAKGGAASDLAAKGIVIINGKPADGRYVGPGGASFLVQRGIIIVENKPSPTRK